MWATVGRATNTSSHGLGEAAGSNFASLVFRSRCSVSEWKTASSTLERIQVEGPLAADGEAA